MPEEIEAALTWRAAERRAGRLPRMQLDPEALRAQAGGRAVPCTLHTTSRPVSQIPLLTAPGLTNRQKARQG
jgi:hypothetical protein